MNRVSASEADAKLKDSREVAFLDVREIMPFGTGHPLLAANAPLSRLEFVIADIVPRKSTATLIIDGGEGEADLAAARLERMGYSDLLVVEGGAPAWAEAGLELFPELEVPTKGFGAFARINGKPRFISPDNLKAALSSDEDWIVLDSRPKPEYQAGNIPGSIDAPGADVLRWFDDLVPDPNTKVCVNCMSATRGILGGLSLVAAGVPNEVHVLHHGTRGWLLDGHDLERGAARFPAPLSARAQFAARERAAAIAGRAGLQIIDRTTLETWQNDRDRTTYVFDVRTPAEFEAGHIPAARNAPEGALIMSPDKYFATVNARIVLSDDDTVRATVTALWLAQMGWGDVAVLADNLTGGVLESGPQPAPTLPETTGETVAADELHRRMTTGNIRVLDVGPSQDFVGANIPGAAWCLRPQLGQFISDASEDVVLTSPDGRVAALAAEDIRQAGGHVPRILILEGGTNAWQTAGYNTDTGDKDLLSPRDDFWLASSDPPGDQRQNVQDYLDWETTLLDDIERGGPSRYQNLIWS